MSTGSGDEAAEGPPGRRHRSRGSGVEVEPTQKILVIDDEEVVLDSCIAILAGRGYEMITATSGEQGLEVAAEASPDLVFVDVKMPGLPGLEVLERLRVADPSIVVIVITGYATVSLAVEAMKRGAFDFLPKPFTPDEFREMTRRGLERRAEVQEQVRERAAAEAAGPVPGAEAGPMAPVPCRILGRWEETYDTVTLALDPPAGWPGFRPGQFNMLYPFGVGESAISISGDPADSGRLLHTVRRVGKVTEALARLQRGDVVGIRGPYGTPWPLGYAAGRDVVVVAGGIGLAPLRPAIHELLSNRDRYRRVLILIGARTAEDLLYPEQIQDWRGRFDVDREVTVDAATGGWRGRVGVVTTLIPRAEFDAEQAVALVVGPEIMMRFTAAELLNRGMTPSRVFVSMERNMKCGLGLCGHCQVGAKFVCRDGAVFGYDEAELFFQVREV
jgi:NAD(P)H-flavin reductase/ActR/RegA family two-component response regulator